jgi:glucokinase
MRGRAGLGIDAGGTFTKLVIVSDGGLALAEGRVPTLPGRGPKAFVARVARGVRELERRSRLRPEAACLAIAGDVDVVTGSLRRSGNLVPFEKFPMRRALSDALGRGVRMHNDANMAAWGCYALELRRRAENMVAVTLGTGVGGGIVLGGKLYTGSTGSAGEVGHMRVGRPDGAPCGCGARGCLEAYGGGVGIVRTARELLAERPGVRSRLRSFPGGRFEPRDVSEAAARGDRLAREALGRLGEALGVGLVGLVYVLNPDAIVFCGGVSPAAPWFMPAVRRALAAETYRGPFGHVRLVVARRPDIGVLGAGLYSLEGEPIE